MMLFVGGWYDWQGENDNNELVHWKQGQFICVFEDHSKYDQISLETR